MKFIGIIILSLILSSCSDDKPKKHFYHDKKTEIRGVIVSPISAPCPLPIKTDEGTLIVIPPPIDIFD